MKKSDFRNYVCLMLLICLSTAQAFAQQGKSLKWTMALQNVKTTETIPFSAPVQSQSGEQFRLVIKPETKSYFYVVYESPDGNELMVLYAGQLKSGETWYSNPLLVTDPEGSESLFIIASVDEQKNLAKSITALEKTDGFSQKMALKTEIKRIRSDVSKFKEAPEKPVLMGGAARGTQEKNQGVEFSGLGTYVKTISIEH